MPKNKDPKSAKELKPGQSVRTPGHTLWKVWGQNGDDVMIYQIAGMVTVVRRKTLTVDD